MSRKRVYSLVALRKESVDRNLVLISTGLIFTVALRKESVDRNSAGACHRAAAHASLSARRAWIEMQVPVFGGRGHGSLSARRAWIEIPKRIKFCAICYVALRKESVDRNGHGVFILILGLGSLSARRAWIEIEVPEDQYTALSGRSPQGERG